MSDLKQRFDELRQEDERRAPSFAEVTSRARRRPSVALVPALSIGVLSLAAMVAIALLVFRRAPEPPLHVGIRDPEPLAFLLAPVALSEELP